MMSKVDFKVVLLGKEFGGKTSIVERFIYQRFVERIPGKHEATIGAAYACKTIDIDGDSVTIAVWDTAGSERYESMSRMYYRNARAAIVCFDVTDISSFERAKFWVSEVKNNEQTCKIFLCGTKIDLIRTGAHERIVSSKLVNGYATAIEAQVFETSSKSGEGVNELFEKIGKDYLDFQMIAENPSHTSSKGFLELPQRKTGCCFS